MRLPYHRLVVALGIIIVAVMLSTVSLSAQSTCSAPLSLVPHQGGGGVNSAIFGLQADISYNTPVYSCRQQSASYTNEWIMIIGPGNDITNRHPEWIQLGWERDTTFSAVHFWWQYIGPTASYCRPSIPYCDPKEGHLDPTQYPISHVRTYKIEAVGDPDPTVGTYWFLYADDIFLGAIAASDLGWNAGSQYGTNAQWSGEVSYAESDMGGPFTAPASFGYPMWTLGSGYTDITTPYTFNANHPRYSGDTTQYPDGTWMFRNWSWYRIFLPLIMK